MFGPQTTDISYGRGSDGQLPWVLFTVPTPGAGNQGTSGIAAHTAASILRAWPNPVVGNVLHFDHSVTRDVRGIDGRILARVSNAVELRTIALASGTYVLRTNNGAPVRFSIP